MICDTETENIDEILLLHNTVCEPKLAAPIKCSSNIWIKTSESMHGYKIHTDLRRNGSLVKSVIYFIKKNE